MGLTCGGNNILFSSLRSGSQGRNRSMSATVRLRSLQSTTENIQHVLLQIYYFPFSTSDGFTLFLGSYPGGKSNPP